MAKIKETPAEKTRRLKEIRKKNIELLRLKRETRKLGAPERARKRETEKASKKASRRSAQLAATQQRAVQFQQAQDQETAQAAIGEQQAGERAARQATAGRLAQAQALLVGQGRVEQARIARQAHLSRGRAEQRLVSSGLGNSTVINPILRAIDERASLASAGVMERVSRLRAGSIQRVSDVPPSRGPILGLLQGIGIGQARRPSQLKRRTLGTV